MELLDLIFLLCAQFVATREKRTYGEWYGKIVVNFHDGSNPVAFYQDRIWAVDDSSSELRWMASRKLNKKERRIAEQVLRYRIKKEKQKLPRGRNNTELYTATIKALRNLHEQHPMESIRMNGKMIAYRTDALGNQGFEDENEFLWKIGTLQLCRKVVLTHGLLYHLRKLPIHIAGLKLAMVFETRLGQSESGQYVSPFTWVEYIPWEKNKDEDQRRIDAYWEQHDIEDA